ncbi:hypothetical protein G6F46_001667 [Rhizopus delemar]|uniref:Uncharacterized protein n=2 Tax=Rhizopus TaxID=4842 RepID=A0A9P6Z6S8_9FUNG|nr:hypothetical protein G6F55_002238 [Rhizopus delemar]KAG1550925.1 hypothetical protein G6F51_002160 [Rhizopus arrhizus]KAG1505482.1 hypothetical protein G6F54_000273 [Rhizopus delemar]KAG1516808.1 hypothetical protein G6F53_001871 [Rhizopus delemar]KAG1527647.1 hypothetical protein G6F52_001347 [Rhizopus delemar]
MDVEHIVQRVSPVVFYISSSFCLIDKPTLYKYYSRLLSSKLPLLSAVTHLTVSKPSEHRHAHFTPLPFENLPSVTHLETRNLCLAEIEYLSRQLDKKQLLSIVCENIETWCDTKRFCFDLVYAHPHLQTAYMNFAEDGNSGFASMIDLSLPTIHKPDNMRQFVLTSIRDGQSSEQKNIISKMEQAEMEMEEFYQGHLEWVEKLRVNLERVWYELEKTVVDKYSPLAKLRHLSHLEFGFCHSWTSKVWTECFYPLISPDLRYLSLHGWDQLGKLGKVGSQCLTIEPIRMKAEDAIASCFEVMPNLRCLQLVDFSIGFGLLKASRTMHQVMNLDIVFTELFVKYFTEPADVWLLTGPLEEFILNIFHEPRTVRGYVSIRLHPKLIREIEMNEFFKDEPFLSNTGKALQRVNVSIDFIPLPEH